MNRKTKYGITPDIYERMWFSQQGRCANNGCAAPLSAENECVDHDHSVSPVAINIKADSVRSLLCHGCNIALGHVHEDAERLRGLAEYVDNFDYYRRRIREFRGGHVTPWHGLTVN